MVESSSPAVKGKFYAVAVKVSTSNIAIQTVKISDYEKKRKTR